MIGECERLETPVVVVGGGVSGCACAASLAEKGVGVTLVDPALDSLGEPRLGPVVIGGKSDPWAERDWLAEVPRPLRDAWEKAAMTSEDGSVVVVDRRLVGLGTKHALELMEGLQMRQGFVVKVDCVVPEPEAGSAAQGEARLETAFGEVLVADALVVAVGLGLGDPLEGLELPSGDGLKESLGTLGAEFRAASAEVGSSFGGDSDLVGHETIPLKRSSKGRGGWVEGGPESPYEREDLWELQVLVHKAGERGEAVLVSPDGLATGELVVAGASGVAGGGSIRVSRPGYIERGLEVTNVDDRGRLELCGRGAAVWVTGRAAGRRGYIESLASGVETARAVAESLGNTGLLRGEHPGS